jgi:hypothetical protein
MDFETILSQISKLNTFQLLNIMKLCIEEIKNKTNSIETIADTIADTIDYNYELDNYDEQNTQTNRPSIIDVENKMKLIINKKYNCPLTRNKGKVGNFLEDLIGIPKSSKCLDCSDGEVKTFPLKRLKNGKIVPKETIAITMLCEKSLINNDFAHSKCFIKMKQIMIIPYIRDNNYITFFIPTIIETKDNIFDTIKKDYDIIREHYIKTGILKSELGEFLQSRTKGSGGKEVKTRAFYLRTGFIKKYITLP